MCALRKSYYTYSYSRLIAWGGFFSGGIVGSQRDFVSGSLQRTRLNLPILVSLEHCFCSLLSMNPYNVV
jgi:hypothetical protein